MIIKTKHQTNGRYIKKKNRDKTLQQQNKRHIHFRDLGRSYVELDNRVKALEENFEMFLNK